MPTHFDKATWKDPTEYNYMHPNSLIDMIAYELWGLNSDEDAIFSYLNDTLIPFVKSHRRQYLCYLTEMYAASFIPTSELGKFDDHGFLTFLEYYYLFGNTAAELKARNLRAYPEHTEHADTQVQPYLQTNGWNSIAPKLSPRLGCDKL